MTDPDQHIPRPVQRFEALRLLFQPGHLRDSLVIAPQPTLQVSAMAGLQSAIVSAIALPIVFLSPWSHLIGFASLGALVALFGRFAPPGKRNRVLLLTALCQVAAVFFMSVAAWLGLPFVGQLAVLALASGLFYFVSILGGFGPPGALIFIFAASAGMVPAAGFDVVMERTLAIAVVSILSVVICAASEVLRRRWITEMALPPLVMPALGALVFAALRMAIGAALAGFAAYALHAPHPAWAAMGAVAVLQGQHLHIRLHRALQRMAGTACGAILVWFLLQAEPSPWTIMIVLVGLQFFTEVLIGANYGLGQMLITPMALLMVHLAALSTTGPELAPERAMVTVLGACIGVALAVLFSSLDERHHLAELTKRQKNG